MTTLSDKQCYKCESIKPLSNFHKETAIKGGFSNYCKECTTKRSRNYYQANRDICNKKNALWKKKHPLRVRQVRWRKAGISITPGEYVALREAQNSRCAICLNTPTVLVVDHCHRTGVVRGLLCSTCNRALGLFADSKERLTKAFEYLGQNG